MQVGVVGLGRMGSAIASRLLEQGHEVVVYNRTRARAEELEKIGARVADTPKAACASDAVITMLADDAAVEAMVFGDDGVLAGLADEAVHVSMSTITVAMAERLDTAHREAGRRFVAAPVFGRPDAARAGQLYVVSAGAPDVLARCKSLFDAIGQKTFVIGDAPPAANLVKLGGNFLIASTIECLGEAVALMRKYEVDPRAFLETMTGSLFAAPVYRTYGGLIVEQKYEPAGFAMPLGLKDVRSALAAAEAKRVPMPVASLLRDHFLSGLARGGEHLDWSALARVIADDAGLARGSKPATGSAEN